jgi:hypothetical protein
MKCLLKRYRFNFIIVFVTVTQKDTDENVHHLRRIEKSVFIWVPDKY